MSSDYDATEFIDSDFAKRKLPRPPALVGTGTNQRAPSREEVDAKVLEAQQKLSELKRAQEELERERSALEETRRRQAEFQTGREEMVQSLTRGLGLLEEAEFSARRDAEQMAKTLGDFRETLGKIQAVNEETWTKDNFSVELTRALTSLENGRMEWNAARLKFPILCGKPTESALTPVQPSLTSAAPFGPQSFGELCRVGFALTWPLALVGLAALGILTALLLRH